MNHLFFLRTFALVMDNEFKYTLLPLSKLEVNKGQIEGVPENPRFIRDERYRKLVKSITDSPEMMTARPLIVHQLGDKYVVLGGNMRLRAMRELKWKQSPCAITSQNATKEKLREYAIKDNLEYGEDDMDILANKWDLNELKEWGMDIKWNDNFIEDEETEAPQQSSQQQYEGLPEELQGVDITPQALPKINGEDEVAYERVIIVYEKDREQEIAKLLKVEKIDKVVYRLDELL